MLLLALTAGVDELLSFSSAEPSEVADAYVHALLGRYPRTLYLVGWDAWVVVLLQALPEWISDWFLVQLAGRNAPLPQALKKRH